MGGLLEYVRMVTDTASESPSYIKVRLGRNKVIFVFHTLDFIQKMQKRYGLENIFIPSIAGKRIATTTFDLREYLNLHIPFPVNAKYDWSEAPPSRNKVGVIFDVTVPKGFVIAGIFISRNGKTVEMSQEYGMSFYSFLATATKLEIGQNIAFTKDPEAVVLRYYTIAVKMGMLGDLNPSVLTPKGMINANDFNIIEDMPFDYIPDLINNFYPSCTLQEIVYAWDGENLVPAATVVDIDIIDHNTMVFLEHQRTAMNTMAFTAKATQDVIGASNG